MTIADEILDLSGRIQSAYTALESKGATLPEDRTTWNLSATVDTLETEAFGAKASQLFHEVEDGVLLSTQAPYSLSVEGVSALANMAFYNSTLPTNAGHFVGIEGLTAISFPELISVGQYALDQTFGKSNIVRVEFPKLAEIG